MMLSIVVPCALTVVAGAQQPSPSPAFEVVSIRLNPNDIAAESIAMQPDGSVRFTAFQVRTLITIAYRSEGIQRFDQLIGVPSWIALDRFDIAAKAGEVDRQNTEPNSLPAMVRALLRDRFRLRVHSDTRSLPAFALMLARRDGKLGPQLRESTAECPTGPATDAEPDSWCGIRTSGGVMTGRAASTGLLAGNLSGKVEVDRFVTDRTGLVGRYDFRLEYSPGFAEQRDAGANARPSLFTALTEQLGLSLRPETVSLPVLIIDNIEKPTPN
jgi:uncharacterized protein (TIGR03435 family)